MPYSRNLVSSTRKRIVDRALFLALAMFVSVTTMSCAPTYPREKLIDGVKQLCKQEYGVEVDVKTEGRTLGVRIPLEGLFDTKTLQITPKALDKIDGVMLSVSRVALSSDRSIDFYTVITTDKNIPGTEVVMTRNVLDLRRYVYGDISRGEFAKRMVFDVRFNPEGIIDNWLGEFTLKETRLDEFMCEQASRRITDAFREDKMFMGKFKISSCEGKLDGKLFKFTVDISREGMPMSELIHGIAWHDQVLGFCLKEVCHIIYIYNFKEFEGVRIYNKFDNKIVETDKNQINYWRKRSIVIE